MSTQAPVTTRQPYVGQSLTRPEDVLLLKGEAVFVADVNRPGQLHARIVRSQFAHGLITGIDTSEAAAVEGVVGVYTGADLPDVRIPIRMELGDVESMKKALQPPLAIDRVRYVGEPIAVVVASSAAAAEDGASLVFADFDEIDAITDVDAALAEDAPPLHDQLEDNVVTRFRWRVGDVDALFAQADVVVKDRLKTSRHSGVPLETRGLVAEYDATREYLTVWGASKVKHFNRMALGLMLGMPEEQINLIEVETGGGFGVRGELYPEDYLIPYLARELGRPVKWIEDRIEHLVATNHSREQDRVLEIAATRDGKLLAFRDNARSDIGGYIRTHGAIVQIATGSQLPGGYDWPGFEMDHALVLTNKTPTGTYRGPGGVEASFSRERLIDRVAHEIGMSPMELRRKNLIRAEQLPYAVTYDEGHGEIVHDTGDYVHLWDELLSHSQASLIEADVDRRRRAGELVGVGTAAFAEAAVIGPWEQARITPEEDGRIRVALGVSSMGQGLRTALGQLAADALGVPFEDVIIDYFETANVPFGFGAFASRVTTVGGNAIVVSIGNLQERAREAAATRFDVDVSEVEVDGHVVRATDGSEATLFELGVIGEGRYDKAGLSVGFGCALAVVSVDPDTGQPTVERLVVGTEAGNPVNPMLFRGQVVGAAAQGLGGTFLESFEYDDYGQPLATTFADYLLPTSLDVPQIEVVCVEVRAPNNPLGLGPAGENGIYGVAPAIANAIAAAVGDGPGVCTTLPLTPEKIWEACARQS